MTINCQEFDFYKILSFPCRFYFIFTYSFKQHFTQRIRDREESSIESQKKFLWNERKGQLSETMTRCCTWEPFLRH